MFNIFKKIYVFLCSACLTCSFGSFVNVYGSESNDSGKIGEFYVQGQLGFEPNRIVLDEIEISNGKIKGVLKWATTFANNSPQEMMQLFNENEDSKIALFLKDTNTNQYVAATREIDLAGKNYSLGDGVALYERDSDDIIEDGDEIREWDEKPGLFEVRAMLTQQGQKSLILAPGV